MRCGRTTETKRVPQTIPNTFESNAVMYMLCTYIWLMWLTWEIFSCLFQLSGDIGYVLYSALGSFYIPSCIMVFVYIRIYFAAKARARRGIKKKPHKRNEQVSVQTLHFSNFIDWSDQHARESFASNYMQGLLVIPLVLRYVRRSHWLLGTLYYKHATCRFVSFYFLTFCFGLWNFRWVCCKSNSFFVYLYIPGMFMVLWDVNV